MPVLEMISKIFDVMLEKSRQQFSNQEKHLAEIKAKVLRPLSGQIDQYYSSACKGNSILFSTSIEHVEDRPDSVTQRVSSTAYYKLSQTTATYQMYYQDPVNFSPYSPGIDAVLFQDCLEFHYPELFKDWVKFHKSFDALVREAIALAERESVRLASKCSLPQSTASDSHSAFNANYVRIGAFIIDRLMERSHYALEIESESGVSYALNIDTERVARDESKSLLDDLIREVDSGFSLNRDDAVALNKRFKELGAVLPDLSRRVRDELSSFKTLSKCPLIS